MRIQIDIDATPAASHNCFSKVSLRCPQHELESEVRVDGKHLYYRLGRPNSQQEDLLLVALLVYGIDRLVPRELGRDGWQRQLEVEVPVSEVNQWTGVKPELESCLRFLTGDLWELSFCQRPSRLFHRLRRRAYSIGRLPSFGLWSNHMPTVSLLSGGLDSLIGTLDLLGGNRATS